MAIPLEELLVKISADVSDLKIGLKQAQDAVRKSSSQMGNAVRTLTRRFLTWTAVVIAARRAIRSFQETVRQVDILDKFSKSLGTSAQTMAAFRFAGKLAGVEMRQLAVGLKMMSKNIGDAARGLGEGREAFRAMRIDTAGLLRLKPEEQYAVIAEAFTKVSSSAQRASLAMKIFGESGVRMLPMLEQGAAGLAQAREATEKFGTALSDARVKDVVAMKDAATTLGEAWQGLKDQFISSIAPGITTALKGMTETIVELRQEGWRSSSVLAQVFGAKPEMGITGGFLVPPEKGWAARNQELFAQARAQQQEMAAIAEERRAEQEQLNAELDALARERQERSLLGMNEETRALSTALMDRLKALEEFYEGRSELADEWRELALKAENDYQKAVTAIERQEILKRAEFRAQLADSTIGLLRELTSATHASAKDQFEINKALGIADVVVNTSRAVMKIWAEQGPFAGPMAALAIATGAAQIANIASTSFEGGGTVGAGGGSTTAGTAPAAAQQQQLVTNVTLVGESFGPDQIRALIEQINEQQQDGVTIQVM